jgi:hypothetical protein
MTTESESIMRAQIAAHASWAQTEDRAARTLPARRGLEAKFLREADGDPVKAESLRKEFYKRMQLASAKARSKVT